jgi:hypothetical protein
LNERTHGVSDGEIIGEKRNSSLRSGRQFQGANIKATTEGGNSKKSMMIMTESSRGCNDTLLLRLCRHLIHFGTSFLHFVYSRQSKDACAIFAVPQRKRM